MWLEFFRFDLKYQLRQPLLWVSAVIFALIAFGATSSDAIQVGGSIGNVQRNAPTVIVNLMTVLSVLSMFIVTVFISGSVLRDSEFGISDMIFATPMKKRDYLIGRFAAGLLACTSIFVLVIFGMILGVKMPWVDAARVGPFSWHPYLWAMGVFILPNLLMIGSLLMLLAATTRSLIYVYVGVLAFFVLWIMAGVFTRDISNEWVAVLLDPFGVRAFARMTRYYTVAEANTTLPALTSFLLYNRVLWMGVSLALFAATVVLFKPQRAGTGKKLFGKARTESVVPEATRTTVIPRITPHTGAFTSFAQCMQILRFDTLSILKSAPFVVMLILAVANFVTSAALSGRVFGTTVYATTSVMLQYLSGSYSFMLVIIVTFFGGELIFKERQAKMHEVTDATPLAGWAPLFAKSLSMGLITLVFLAVGGITAACIQLVKGGAAIEYALYAKHLLIDASGFMLFGLLGIVLQVLTNNRFIGYLVIILVMVIQAVLGFLHFDHNLYNFGAASQHPYSDMNGYGHFLTGWAWFRVYWFAFVFAGLFLANALWVRGVSDDWKSRMSLARQRLRGGTALGLAASVLVIVGSGAWIFYNTNVLNEYVPGDIEMDRKAEYEKKYRQYIDAPLLKVTDVKVNVDIFPETRGAFIRGHYRLENKTSAPIDTLYINYVSDKHVSLNWTAIPAHDVKVHDQQSGFDILKLKQAVAPGAGIDMDFDLRVQPTGFSNRGDNNRIQHNGTFFDNSTYFPQFGYDENGQLQDRNERKKRGLGEPQRMAKLEDVKARNNSLFGASSDFITFDATVSTSADQIALAPGYLKAQWEKDGRRYYHYVMDRPMVNFASFQSARYQVKKGEWHGLPIEIYHDPKHAYNVDRMIYGVQKSLDYFTTQFSPYQHKQVRILEFPSYAEFAQSFANTIPFSEGIGFIADLRDKEDLDYVYYVTAHEMAHQWWGHQEVGAGMQGSTMLIESLAQYSALMVMEKEYGRDHMRRFLKYELDGYLRGRGGEVIEEQPLYRAENQQYIHYRKGSLVFYRLRDEIGEAALNKALRNFLAEYAFKAAPYPTSLDLLRYIRAETPADKQSLITDLFEKITFYDNRITEASAKKLADGKWEVTMKVHTAKLESDGQGKESARTFDEPVDIAVFSRAEGGKEKDETVLFREKRALGGGDHELKVVVKNKPYEVGVDPFNIMIDRVPADNRKVVTIQ
ncbi:hypothetical protein KSF73_10870 [Burkholderiaceae bacterium DAT-1]|nr:hypothetical protein [Burkholderiaceae bacterium DAT-1]